MPSAHARNIKCCSLRDTPPFFFSGQTPSIVQRTRQQAFTVVFLVGGLPFPPLFRSSLVILFLFLLLFLRVKPSRALCDSCSSATRGGSPMLLEKKKENGEEDCEGGGRRQNLITRILALRACHVGLQRSVLPAPEARKTPAIVFVFVSAFSPRVTHHLLFTGSHVSSGGRDSKVLPQVAFLSPQTKKEPSNRSRCGINCLLLYTL